MSRGFMDYGLRGHYCQNQEHRPRFARRTLVEGGMRKLMCEDCYERRVEAMRFPVGNKMAGVTEKEEIVTVRE